MPLRIHQRKGIIFCPLNSKTQLLLLSQHPGRNMALSFQTGHWPNNLAGKDQVKPKTIPEDLPGNSPTEICLL